jgi:hypothetical protein
LAISEGNWGAAWAVEVTSALSPDFHHDIFGADLQPKKLQPIARDNPSVMTLTLMASVPSISVICVLQNRPGFAFAGCRGLANHANRFDRFERYNPYY